MPDEESQYKDAVKNRIIGLMKNEDYIKTENQMSRKCQREKDIDFLFNPENSLSLSLERMASFDEALKYQQEIDKYLREPTIPRGDNPLPWWSSKRHKFPLLASLARKYLSIPASSTPSERVFSTAGNIISAKRSCLTPKHANVLIFLYQNRKILEKLFN